MKIISLYFLLLRLSKALRSVNHLDLIFIKEALINYYNETASGTESVRIDFKNSINSFIINRSTSSTSCAVLKALVTHLINKISDDDMRSIIGDLILIADSSISALEEAKSLRAAHDLWHARGKYYYNGSLGSDVAKVRYLLIGESRGKSASHALTLTCEPRVAQGNVIEYLLPSLF
uniref:19.6 kDa protein n=1 Tax=Grapevine leafroll-associated virus 3 TaxID=55951 RepID=A0A0F6NUB2_9CLOS|nr:19.6 kDa protein [Grapevine leafroll-associated virus 3]